MSPLDCWQYRQVSLARIHHHCHLLLCQQTCLQFILLLCQQKCPLFIQYHHQLDSRQACQAHIHHHDLVICHPVNLRVNQHYNRHHQVVNRPVDHYHHPAVNQRQSPHHPVGSRQAIQHHNQLVNQAGSHQGSRLVSLRRNQLVSRQRNQQDSQPHIPPVSQPRSQH